jgi:hypothetical protein
MRNLETMDVWDEVSAETGRQKWSEGPRWRTAAMSEETISPEATTGKHSKT